MTDSIFGEIVHSYPREQAIEDGELVDISTLAETREAGFRVPVAVTRSVWNLVEVPDELKGSQDLKGRLWDLCFMACLSFRSRKAQSDNIEACRIVKFRVIFQMTEKLQEKPELWLVFNEHEGFTIMRPEDY